MNTLKRTALQLSAFALAAAVAALPGMAASKKAPASAKQARHSAADTLTIINSGDQLSPGYRVTVTPEGAVHGVVRTRTGKVTIDRRDRMIGATRDRLFQDLRDALPLNQLGAAGGTAAPLNPGQAGRGRRGGSGSSTQATTTGTARVTGPQVFVIYQGVRSPNLRAASDDKGKELYQRVKQAIELVRLPIPDTP